RGASPHHARPQLRSLPAAPGVGGWRATPTYPGQARECPNRVGRVVATALPAFEQVNHIRTRVQSKPTPRQNRAIRADQRKLVASPARAIESAADQPVPDPTPTPTQWEAPGRSVKMGAMHPGAAKVQQALRDAGAKGEVQMLPNAVRTAAQAAEALGVHVGQIVKSLIFEAG